MTGNITDIERYAINDGFGLRTTVFLKGCPARCRWCSNPETQQFHSEMIYFQDKCIGCGACKISCPYEALDKDLQADRSICKECHTKEDAFKCIEHCYPKCRKNVGEEKTVQEVVTTVKRDMPFYQMSGGGVTISGGEPLAQPEFLYELLKELSDSWIDTAIETCGIGKSEDYRKIAPYLNFAFIDMKSADNEKHREWVGIENHLIKKNIILMDKLSKEYSFELIIRTPVIPGFNDSKKDIEAIADFITSNCKNYKGMELLPYHRLGRGKYISLGREYILSELNSPTDEHMNELYRILEEYDIPIYQF